MTISSTTNRASFSGNGVTTLFSFPYRFLVDADLVVIEKVTATGVETVKTLTTHYTVSGAGGANGGSITMLIAPASGKEIIIYRDHALTQELDLVENDQLPAESVEQGFDRLTMITQRLKEVDQRTVRLPEGFTGTFSSYLPAMITADAVLKIDSIGEGFAMGPTTTEIEEAEANAIASAASAAEAEASKSAAETAQAAAEAAQIAAENAVDSVLWNDVRYITSNTVVPDDAAGVLYVVDATSGPIAITLPTIANLDLVLPFSVAIKKTDASANAITISRSGSDTINGAATSKTVETQGAGAVFVPDLTNSPDDWTSLDIGVVADNSVTTTKIVNEAVTLSKLAAEVLNALFPRGFAIPGIRDTVPSGFVSCMNKTLGLSGADYSGTTYYNLYADIWTLTATTTTAEIFKISSTKGASAAADWAAGKLITIDFYTNEIFIRAKGLGRDLGSFQDDAFEAHTHVLGWDGSTGSNQNCIGSGAQGGANDGTVTTTSVGGTETRPKNGAFNWVMKY